jgi:hypothetical protein
MPPDRCRRRTGPITLKAAQRLNPETLVVPLLVILPYELGQVTDAHSPQVQFDHEHG